MQKLFLIFLLLLGTEFAKSSSQNHNRNGSWSGNQGNQNSTLGIGINSQQDEFVGPQYLFVSERNQLLGFVNGMRRKLAQGVIENVVDSITRNFNGVVGMFELQWDVLLEDRARYFSTFCPPSNNNSNFNPRNTTSGSQKSTKRNNNSMNNENPQNSIPPAFVSFMYHNEIQNTYTSHNKASRVEILMEAAQNWWSQIRFSQINLGMPMATNDPNHAQFQAWKNLATSFITKMGCAVNICNHNGNTFESYVVCLFATDSNFPPERNVFVPGPGCQSNRDCSIYPDSVCYKSYCITSVNQLPRPIERQFRDEILADTNRTRIEKSRGKLGEGQPLMSNVYKVEWNEDLEERAQRISLSCQPQPYQFGPIDMDISQNFFVYPTPSIVDVYLRSQILQLANKHWRKSRKYTEPLEIDLGHLPGEFNVPNTLVDPQQFSNMTYFRATDIGCALNLCDHHSIVVCLYKKGGQDLINHPYQGQGGPCKNDNECSEFPGSWCETRTGLCVDVYKGTYKTPVEPLPQGLKNGIVRRMNNIRREIVKNLDLFGPPPSRYEDLVCRPTGASQYELNWNMGLEQRARAIASWCKPFPRLRYQYIGENWFVTPQTNIDEKELLKKAFKKWRREVRQSNGPLTCVNFDTMHYGGYVDIACAANRCIEPGQGFSLVVCLFQRWQTVPRFDQKIPFVKRCESNADCQLYSNASCEPASGLCRLNNPEQNGSGILSANMYNSNGIGPNGSSMNASINNNSITNTNNPNGRNSTTNSQSINNNDDDNADGVSNADDPQTDEDVDPEMS